MQAALVIVELETFQADKGYFQYSISTAPNIALPCGIGHQLSVRAGDVEIKGGQFAAGKGAANCSWVQGFDDKGKLAGRDSVDFIFKPDPSAAGRSVDTVEIWGGELIFKDVKIKRPAPPGTAPATPVP
jgi:hypothetical protein